MHFISDSIFVLPIILSAQEHQTMTRAPEKLNCPSNFEEVTSPPGQSTTRGHTYFLQVPDAIGYLRVL